MRLLIVVTLCALALAVSSADNVQQTAVVEKQEIQNAAVPSVESRNIFVNALVRQLMAFIRHVVNNGWDSFGIRPLDPLIYDHIRIRVPAQIVNLNLDLDDVKVTGFGAFITERSTLDIGTLALDLDIRMPQVDISAGKYDLLGDIFNAIPLFGKGDAKFVLTNFNFRATLFLKQSGESTIIDRIENVSLELPEVKSSLTGIIGGGDIDNIVNAMIEDVLKDYVNRFHGAVGLVASRWVLSALNPLLEQLDTWRFLAPFVRD